MVALYGNTVNLEAWSMPTLSHGGDINFTTVNSKHMFPLLCREHPVSFPVSKACPHALCYTYIP